MNLASYTKYKTPADFVRHNIKMAEKFIESRIEPINDTIPPEVYQDYLADRLRKHYEVAGLKDFVWLFACTKCGASRLPTPILVFFKFRVDKLKCYSCQKR